MRTLFRTFTVLATIAYTVSLASCSKDNGGEQTAERAVLNIGVSAPANSRAAGSTAAPTPPEDAVGNFTVFVTDQSGAIQWRGHQTGAEPLEVEVTTAAKEVYVVANAGNLSSVITTMADLNNYIADLNGAETGATLVAGKQTANRWSTGKGTVSAFTQSGSTFRATATVPLTFIAARITLKIGAIANYAAGADDGSLVLNSVAVLNARGQSKLFPASSETSLIPASYSANKKFYEGLADGDAHLTAGFAYYPASGTFTDVSATTSFLTDAIPADFSGQTFYYYVFENDAATAEQFPTIVTIKGTYDGRPIYFPVHLAPYEQFTSGSDSFGGSVTRGKSYDITVTLKGDPRFAQGRAYPGLTGGVDDPTEPLVDATVEVTINTPDWEPVTLGKEF
jgi:hypothetical protein